MSVDLDAIEAVEKAMTPEWSAVFVAGAGWHLRGVLGGESAGRNFVEYTLRGDSPVTLMIETWHQFEPPEWTAAQKANFEGAALLRNAAPEMFRRIREQDAEIKRLRAWCGKAADRIRSFVVADEVDHPEKLPDEAAVELCYHLRWASKGEQ